MSSKPPLPAATPIVICCPRGRYHQADEQCWQVAKQKAVVIEGRVWVPSDHVHEKRAPKDVGQAAIKRLQARLSEREQLIEAKAYGKNDGESRRETEKEDDVVRQLGGHWCWVAKTMTKVAR